jgi:hypothetical protein
MERFYEVMYQGHKILMFDHQSLRGDALLDNLKAGTQWLQAYPEDNVLSLADFSGCYATDEVVAYLQNDESKQAARKIKKSAVVGVTGIKKLFLNLYNVATGTNTRIFKE